MKVSFSVVNQTLSICSVYSVTAACLSVGTTTPASPVCSTCRWKSDHASLLAKAVPVRWRDTTPPVKPWRSSNTCPCRTNLPRKPASKSSRRKVRHTDRRHGQTHRQTQNYRSNLPWARRLSGKNITLTMWYERFKAITGLATHLESREKSGEIFWWKSQGGNVCDEKVRIIHKKTVKVTEESGKRKLFSKCLRKCYVFYFYILSKYKSYRCYFCLYCWHIEVREKHFKSGKSQGKLRFRKKWPPWRTHTDFDLAEWHFVLVHVTMVTARCIFSGCRGASAGELCAGRAEVGDQPGPRDRSQAPSAGQLWGQSSSNNQWWSQLIGQYKFVFVFYANLIFVTWSSQ